MNTTSHSDREHARCVASTPGRGNTLARTGGRLLAGLWISATLTSAQSIRTIAGNGEKGYSGEGRVATDAKLDDPTGLTRGPDDALYFCDTGNHRIRKITRDGKIVTVAGTGQRGWTGDGGPATEARLNEPYEVRFDAPKHIVWVERLNHAVRQLELNTGIVTTIAGNGGPGFSGDGGPAVRAKLNDPHSIVFDSSGNLYIADVRNHRIRKVARDTGIITTFAGTGERESTPDGARFVNVPLHGPRALDIDRLGNLWVALREGNAVLRLDITAGTVHHVAGNGTKGFTGNDGPARDASFNGPKGLSVAPNGNVYVADTENHAIRMINMMSGTIELVAGTGERGDGPSGAPLHCRLARPHGVFVDLDGSVFIGDSQAHRVRVIRPNRQ